MLRAMGGKAEKVEKALQLIGCAPGGCVSLVRGCEGNKMEEGLKDEDEEVSLEIMRLQVTKRFPIDKWKAAMENGEVVKYTIKGNSVKLAFEIICKKNENKTGRRSVSVYLYGPNPHKNKNLTMRWAAKFDKLGKGGGPVRLEDGRSYQVLLPKRPLTLDLGLGCGTSFGDLDEISSFAVDGFLVFKAEVELCFDADKNCLYHEEKRETEEIFKGLRNRFQDDSSDFTIVCEGKNIKCHKVVLASQSEYFSTLFKTHQHNNIINFFENKNDVVTLEDTDFNTMELLIQYLYSLELPKDLSQDQVCELLVAADRLQVPQLVSRCISILMNLVDDKSYIQTFILIDKFDRDPESAAKEDLLLKMKKNEEGITRSQDFPELISRYPELKSYFIVC